MRCGGSRGEDAQFRITSVSAPSGYRLARRRPLHYSHTVLDNASKAESGREGNGGRVDGSGQPLDPSLPTLGRSSLR